MKIILHIDEASGWKKGLRNAENLMAAKQTTHPDLEVEIVANGQAVRDILKTTATAEYQSAFTSLHKQGVRLCACHHSLERIHVRDEAVLDCFDIVPAGVIEIAEREQEGYSYIKP